MVVNYNKITRYSEQILLCIYILLIGICGFSHVKGLGLLLILPLLFFSIRKINKNETPIILKIFSSNGFYILSILQLVGWYWAMRVNYLSLEYRNFDTGIFANLMYEYFRSGNYYSNILGMHGLGDHFSPILIVLSSIYNFNFSFLILIFGKIFAYLATAYLLLQISKQVLGENSEHRFVVFVVPILFLVSRYVCSTLAMEFQPSSLALPFVALVFLLVEKKLYLGAYAVLIILLGFKEHMSLVWVSVGVFLIFFKGKWSNSLGAAGLTTIITGICLGFYIHFCVMPIFSGSVENVHGYRFGPFDLIGTKILFLTKIFLFIGFLPLFNPKTLLFILPAFGISLISKDPLMLELIFHYHDIGMVVLMIGAIYGLKSLVLLKEIRFYDLRFDHIKVVQLICVIGFVMNSGFPSRVVYKNWPTETETRIVSQMENLTTRLLQSECHPSKVYAMENIGPYLFKVSNLKSILKSEQHFFIDGRELLIIAPQADRYPLTDLQFQSLLDRLTSASKLQKISAVNWNKDVLVFLGRNVSEACKEIFINH